MTLFFIVLMSSSYQWLPFRVNIGPMEGMAGDDVNIGGEMLFQGCNLWGFARCLSADYGIHLGS